MHRFRFGNFRNYWRLIEYYSSNVGQNTLPFQNNYYYKNDYGYFKGNSYNYNYEYWILSPHFPITMVTCDYYNFKFLLGKIVLVLFIERSSFLKWIEFFSDLLLILCWRSPRLRIFIYWATIIKILLRNNDTMQKFHFCRTFFSKIYHQEINIRAVISFFSEFCCLLLFFIASPLLNSLTNSLRIRQYINVWSQVLIYWLQFGWEMSSNYR